ncbi:uroporphyrinogen-III C-methyltransferase [Bacillus sp. ISL-4]|uniref:uroporphyrinogen-III C-methyltransferase n=1 Tax=Bacillus sp. ISL-4 TaxID=2819125 RepID=UPI001BE4E279|nr:uroporphyrinogen-III C-methyltransferase [Bacillus sp. ISL-4]MBT2666331.1 uroporphyrinogen-III C-methyltransferase [Bacillus sp. ISL-4]MBT2670791.1 uroporphyrinogen-III C-methyltransferase [Streptomyces sp. ISL-14]
MTKGKVYFVGAGPGDVGLISVKGQKAIEKADIILYDRLLNPKLLEAATLDCELIYCGKTPYTNGITQGEINGLLISKAMAGHRVVRLKGGDPSVFGRVGEEAESLKNVGIPFEVIPGVTSSIAASMYAGVPVTHRDYGRSFAMVTGHEQTEKDMDWNGLVKSIDTVAFYMGVANLPYIRENLINHGKPGNTPALVIQWGTYGRQESVEGTLDDIVERVSERSLGNPAITLVGDIISLRGKLQWFEKKPLFGQRFLVARTGTAKSSLAETLDELGGEVIEFPKWNAAKVKIDESQLLSFLLYDRILFTSPESVHGFLDSLTEHAIDFRRISSKLYVLSRKSKKALQQRGLMAELKSEMSEAGTLLVVGDRNRDQRDPAHGDGDYFQSVDKFVDERFLEILPRMLDGIAVGTVLFSNRHSVDMLMQYGKKADVDVETLLNQASIGVIGESTGNRLKDYGFILDMMPKEPSVEQLVELILNRNVF